MARRFNHLFGEVLPEPEPLVTPFARFPGTDGRRMSKSLGNTIEISATPDEIRAKLRPAFTDPARQRRSDPGNPEICAIYTYYRKFMPEEAALTAEECRTAKRGCVDCKKRLAEGVVAFFAPLRERRAGYEEKPQELEELIREGNRRAQEAARGTMALVREAMDLG
jgi:tryptophanyl-tRNA synthetase